MDGLSLDDIKTSREWLCCDTIHRCRPGRWTRTAWVNWQQPLSFNNKVAFDCRLYKPLQFLLRDALSAKHGITAVRYPSVRRTLMYRGYRALVSWKVITW